MGDYPRDLCVLIIFLVAGISLICHLYETRLTKLIFSLVFTALSVLIFWLCRREAPYQKPVSSPSTVIYADTTRTRLLHRAEQSTDTLIIVHQRTQTSVTHYENSVQHFDSIQVVLP